jgi:4-coumarate--CoA ligase (photoactive yellow protein activation family)
MSPHDPPLAPWWRPRWVRAVLADLLRDELRRLRPGAVPAVPSPVVSPDAPDASNALDAGDPLAELALDSIELLDLATAVSLRFGLHHHDLDRRLLAEPRLATWAETVIEGRCRDDAHIAFFTSGSTGRPQRCAHEMAALVQEVTHWAGQVGTPRRVLRAVPCHHIYGFLFTVMLPAQLGIDVIDVRGALPAGVLARTEPGDLLVGHPGFFALAAADAGAAANVLAVTSTGQCPDFVWAALVDAGVSRVLEVYGSSECAGIGSRLNAAAPFTLLPWWIPEPGRARLLRTLGEPCIAQDRWEWVDRRRFRVHGRLDGAVQVAGENVFPGRVRDVLLTHPAVADAAVRAFGEDVAVRLKAFVVPADPDADPLALRRALDPWLAARLRPAERPRRIDVGASLPQTPAGKPADW